MAGKVLLFLSVKLIKTHQYLEITKRCALIECDIKVATLKNDLAREGP